jgi:hypothetical protein
MGRRPFTAWLFRLTAASMTAAAGVLIAVLPGPSPAAASFVSAVTVTSNELHGGPECLDRNWGVVCPRPDLFARAVINLDDGIRVCPVGPVTDNAENVVADQVLCSGVETTGDFSVTFELWDSDEEDTAGARQQGDLAAGDAMGWTTPRYLGGTVQSRGYTTSGGPSTAVFTVAVTQVTTTIGVSQPGTFGTSFDPALGERAWIRGTLTKPARLRFVITAAATGQSFELTSGPFWSGIFAIDWDGRRFPGSGSPMALGDYTVTVSDVSHADPATRPSVSRPIRIIQRPSSLLTVTGVRPASPWDLANGPLSIDGLTGQGGTFWAEVSARQASGPCGPVLARTPEQQRGSGKLEFSWDGRIPDGSLFAAGGYCLRLAGRSPIGAPLGPSTASFVEVAPRTAGLEVFAATNPAVPAALPAGGRGTIQIVAETLATNHQQRYAASITIEATAARAPGGTMPAAPRVLKRCEREQRCIADLPADLASAEAVAYRVSAAERPDVTGPAAVTGTWRITDLNPLPNRVWRVSAPAVVSGEVGGTPVTSQIDVVYYPGTGYALGDPLAASRFSATVGDNLWQLLGAGPRGRFASTVAGSWDLVAIHVARIPVTVSHTGGTTPGSDTDLCERGGSPTVSFGEVHGVLHTVDCRDNAWNGIFTADDPKIGWHEFHHAAYAEEDEYCCDGGYGDGINMYESLGSCEVKSSAAATCKQLSEFLNGTLTVMSWWRSDTKTDDVMITNSEEDLDDLRAAATTYARCRAGRC